MTAARCTRRWPPLPRFNRVDVTGRGENIKSAAAATAASRYLATVTNVETDRIDVSVLVEPAQVNTILPVTASKSRSRTSGLRLPRGGRAGLRVDARRGTHGPGLAPVHYELGLTLMVPAQDEFPADGGGGGGSPGSRLRRARPGGTRCPLGRDSGTRRATRSARARHAGTVRVRQHRPGLAALHRHPRHRVGHRQRDPRRVGHRCRPSQQQPIHDQLGHPAERWRRWATTSIVWSAEARSTWWTGRGVSAGRGRRGWRHHLARFPACRLKWRGHSAARGASTPDPTTTALRSGAGSFCAHPHPLPGLAQPILNDTSAQPAAGTRPRSSRPDGLRVGR